MTATARLERKLDHAGRAAKGEAADQESESAKPMTHSQKTVVFVRVDEQLHRATKASAHRAHKSLTDFCRRAIEAAVIKSQGAALLDAVQVAEMQARQADPRNPDRPNIVAIGESLMIDSGTLAKLLDVWQSCGWWQCDQHLFDGRMTKAGLAIRSTRVPAEAK